MQQEILKDLGLNAAQAKVYLLLVQNGANSPPNLATLAGESRTTVYSILEKLESLGLVSKSEVDKKYVFAPTNPNSLEKLAEAKYQKSAELKQRVSANMSQFLTYFYTYQNRPGVRFFEGREGIVAMYEDQLRTREDIYFLRSGQDVNVVGETIYAVIEKRARLGIKVYGIEPAESDNMSYGAKNDKRLGRTMTYYKKGYYTAPVNIYTYGNKTALISYGSEVIGTIVESPQIAEAFVQIHKMLKDAAELSSKANKKVK